MAEPQKRDHFRVVYDSNPKPTLLFSTKTFPVADVSEKGFRFLLNGVTGLKVDDIVLGTVTFPDTESFIIRGAIIRIHEDSASVLLTTEIPLRKIVSEQRRLIAKYDKFE